MDLEQRIENLEENQKYSTVNIGRIYREILYLNKKIETIEKYNQPDEQKIKIEPQKTGETLKTKLIKPDEILKNEGEKNSRNIVTIIPPINMLVSGKDITLKTHYTSQQIVDIFKANKEFYQNVGIITNNVKSKQKGQNIIPPAAIGIFYGYASLFYPAIFVKQYLFDIVDLGKNNCLESEIREEFKQKVNSKTAYNMLAHGWNLKIEGKSWSRNKYNFVKVKLLWTEGNIIDYKIVEL